MYAIRSYYDVHRLPAQHRAIGVECVGGDTEESDGHVLLLLVLDQGAAIAEGKPEEVQRNEQVINIYLGEESYNFV